MGVLMGDTIASSTLWIVSFKIMSALSALLILSRYVFWNTKSNVEVEEPEY